MDDDDEPWDGQRIVLCRVITLNKLGTLKRGYPDLSTSREQLV